MPKTTNPIYLQYPSKKPGFIHKTLHNKDNDLTHTACTSAIMSGTCRHFIMPKTILLHHFAIQVLTHLNVLYSNRWPYTPVAQ